VNLARDIFLTWFVFSFLIVPIVGAMFHSNHPVDPDMKDDDEPVQFFADERRSAWGAPLPDSIPA
jgi:hypothetical protein